MQHHHRIVHHHAHRPEVQPAQALQRTGIERDRQHETGNQTGKDIPDVVTSQVIVIVHGAKDECGRELYQDFELDDQKAPQRHSG